MVHVRSTAARGSWTTVFVLTAMAGCDSGPPAMTTPALESAKDIVGDVRDKAVAGAKVADQTIRENPYQAIAIGVGVGALIGFLVARRCSRNVD